MTIALFKNKFSVRKDLLFFTLLFIVAAPFLNPKTAQATAADGVVQPYDLSGKLEALNGATQGSLATQSWYSGDVTQINTQANNVYNAAISHGQTSDQAQTLANTVLEAGAIKIESTAAAGNPGYLDSLNNLIGETFPTLDKFTKAITGEGFTSEASRILAQPYEANAAYLSVVSNAQTSAGNTQQAANTNRLAAGNTQTANDAKGGDSGPVYCIKNATNSTGFIPDFSPAGCVALFSYQVLWVTSWALFASALAFNFTIAYTLNMAVFLHDTPIVDIGWSTFRNISNLVFIFIIIWIAINTILGLDGFGIKKMLGKVIITAILINFSLFFTQALIDFSNIIALQFYSKILTSAQANTAGTTAMTTDGGISAAVSKAMGLDTVWQVGTSAANGNVSGAANPSQNSVGLNSGNLILIGLGGSIFILITAFVFFAGTIMLMLRAIELLFLMILSPLAFIGGLLPATAGAAKEWQKKLTSNLLFAPAYMIMLYLVMSMIMKRTVGGGNFFQLFSGNSVMGPAIIVNFLVLNALMIGCLVVAVSVGASGSKWAMKTGSSWSKWGGDQLKNRSLTPVRFTAGGAASAIRNSEALKSAASSRIGRAFGAGMLLRGADNFASKTKIGGKSFDEARKAKEGRLTRTAELVGEVKRRDGESSADFAKRKKQAAENSFRSLGGTFDAKGDPQSTSFGYGARASVQGITSKKIGAEAKKGSAKTAREAQLKKTVALLDDSSGKYSEASKNTADAAATILRGKIASERARMATLTDIGEITVTKEKIVALQEELSEQEHVGTKHEELKEKRASLESTLAE